MRAKPSVNAGGAWRLALLAALFLITLTSQVPFTLDVIRACNGDYPRQPVGLDSSWPSIGEAGPSAKQAGLRGGDRVISIDGRAPEGLKDLAQPVHRRHPGD